MLRVLFQRDCKANDTCVSEVGWQYAELWTLIIRAYVAIGSQVRA